MKSILLTTIAAVVLVGCGESQQSAPPPEANAVEPVAEAAKPEPPKFLTDILSEKPASKPPTYVTIHDAARRGNIGFVKYYLAKGIDINIQGNFKKYTPLHEAIAGRQLEVVKLLIDEGANVNAKDRDGWTPLDNATGFLNKPKIADLLRKHGGKTGEELKAAEPVSEAKPANPIAGLKLTFAAASGNKKYLEQYLAKGGSPNAKDKDGWTLLHLTAYNGHKDIVELLITNGADVNAKLNLFGEIIRPIEVVKEGHPEIADLLRKHGGKYGTIHTAAGGGDIEAVKEFLAAGVDVNAKDEVESTPLHGAAQYGHLETVELLIAKGADVNAKDEDGETPLDDAEGETAVLLRKHGGKTSYWFKAGESIHIATVAGHIEAVKQHLAAGAEVNAKDEDGLTPLDHAVWGGHTEVAELLIANGADVNAKDKYGWTPLLHAARKGHKEIVELLIDKGADVKAKNGWLRTSLHFATTKEIAELLIDKGADVKAKDDGESTPLHNASLEGHKETAELFIAKGADVNAKDEDGKTPLDDAEEVREDDSPENKAAKKETADLLRKYGGKSGAKDSIHVAATVGNIEIVQQHLDAGVDVNTKNKLGRTPLLYAIQEGHKEIAELLIAKGAIQVPRIRIDDAVRQSNIEAIKQHLAAGTNVDERDYDRKSTPLHLAADFGEKEIAELLVSGGANVNAKSGSKTPLDYALSLSHLGREPSPSRKAIATLLRKHGGKTGEELKAAGN
ncbi:ankyrin repeat domain-containing protein [bacterium]|nr:ankyrin repeat domain-containing protein [bacterium]